MRLILYLYRKVPPNQLPICTVLDRVYDDRGGDGLFASALSARGILLKPALPTDFNTAGMGLGINLRWRIPLMEVQ
jgi:hypothetical protein